MCNFNDYDNSCKDKIINDHSNNCQFFKDIQFPYQEIEFG